MSLFTLVFTVLWFLLFVWALADIIKAHKSTEWKILWVLICLVFPVGGTIVYYFFARQKNIL